MSSLLSIHITFIYYPRALIVEGFSATILMVFDICLKSTFFLKKVRKGAFFQPFKEVL